MKKILIVCLVLVWPAVVFAGEAGVPQVLSFESKLFDDGGNPVADGDVGVTFRIMDDAGAILYEEHQSMRAAGGFVSALVGNGIAANGAPAGPIQGSIFDTGGPFYLEVQADGEPPAPVMEIASVPFAMRSEVALRVADGAVESKSIADGGISFEDLSSKAVEDIAKAVTGGRDTGGIVFREDLETMYRMPNSAASIGVKPDFIYSGSNNLQDVLADFDRSIKARDDRLTSESEERKSLSNAETEARETAISAEAAARQNADESEAGARQSAINAEVSARQGAIAAEAATRQSADAAEITARQSAISAESTARQNAISSEVGLRQQGDSNLGAAISNESTARQQGDSSLSSAISDEASARQQADSSVSSQAQTALTNTFSAYSRQFASAWGSVSFSGSNPYLNSGLNAGVSRVVTSGYRDKVRVTFPSPMSSAAYAVVTTAVLGGIPTSSQTPVSAAVPVYEKTAGGFSVVLGYSFDFIVIGP